MMMVSPDGSMRAPDYRDSTTFRAAARRVRKELQELERQAAYKRAWLLKHTHEGLTEEPTENLRQQSTPDG
jgi:hypothetical protein